GRGEDPLLHRQRRRVRCRRQRDGGRDRGVGAADVPGDDRGWDDALRPDLGRLGVMPDEVGQLGGESACRLHLVEEPRPAPVDDADREDLVRTFGRRAARLDARPTDAEAWVRSFLAGCSPEADVPWLPLLEASIDELFSGPSAEAVKERARAAPWPSTGTSA